MFTCDPNLEIDGHSASSLLRSMLSDQYIDLLQAHSLDQIDEEEWYVMQDILNLLSDLADRGSMMELVSIGMAAADASILPPEVSTMNAPDFLLLYHKIFPTRWRNADPGHVGVHIIDDKHLNIDNYTTLPDDLFYGLMYGFIRRFNQSGKPFTVSYDDTHPRRSQGGAYTRLNVKWN